MYNVLLIIILLAAAAHLVGRCVYIVLLDLHLAASVYAVCYVVLLLVHLSISVCTLYLCLYNRLSNIQCCMNIFDCQQNRLLQEKP